MSCKITQSEKHYRNHQNHVKSQFTFPFWGRKIFFFFSEYICVKEFEKLQQINSTSTSLIVLINSTSTSLTRNILFDNR